MSRLNKIFYQFTMSCTLIISCSVLALPNDDNPTWSPVQKIAPPQLATNAISQSETNSTGSMQLTEQDLRADIKLTENLINQALITSQWDLLADLLVVYQTMPLANQNLYRYAQGALLRAHRKHSQAIENYRQILAEQADLDYVRFDYMALLFENRQFKQAQQQIALLQQKPLELGLQQLIADYQQAIERAQSWQFDGNLQYEKNDNVNNASDQREVQIGNRRFIRNEKSLPQSATGFAYAGSLAKVKNLFGNHFAVGKFGVDGVYYWDNKKYNEERLNAQFGYQYQDVSKTFRLLPRVEFEWFSGDFYNRKYGVLAQYSQWLTPTWQINGSLARHWRYYVNKSYAETYNGTQNQATLIFSWYPNAQWMIYAGGDWSQQKTRDQEESSIRKGIQIGFSYEWRDWLGFSTDLRYGTRQFAREHFLFALTRRDKEKQATLKIWSPKLEWHGVMPKLSYQILRVDSNLAQLYQRRNNQLWLEIEKRF